MQLFASFGKCVDEAYEGTRTERRGRRDPKGDERLKRARYSQSFCGMDDEGEEDSFMRALRSGEFVCLCCL